VRAFLPSIGGFDFSPIVIFFVISLLMSLIGCRGTVF
jgi:uncharacterized protein YggT (Ycf19 family)